uniref:Uncharacterized protein n=1 Tax=Meloidogyne enterolobii TaxID=390850 RepID=A0A6V7YC86_MELEN|nr:unnamed protein product [Meloidogyne enterolobii]
MGFAAPCSRFARPSTLLATPLESTIRGLSVLFPSFSSSISRGWQGYPIFCIRS